MMISNPHRYTALAVLGLVILFWCQLFYQLQIEWSANEQYAYGWFVPVLAAGLLWRRWQDRPALEIRSQKSEVSDSWSAVSRQSFLFAGLCLLLCFLLFPLRLIHEANAGWRSAQWLHALILATLTLAMLWRIGGRSWVRHFAFPVLFLLVAVPWPSRLEESIVQNLMRLSAAISVEVVVVLDVPAMRHGNLIEIGSGTVSVDGACSGVRSLQTSIMAALLLGELYSLSGWRRVALVPAGVVIALLANTSRTSFLTWSAARQGLARMESWHDSAGLSVVVMVFVGLWLLAWTLARGGRRSDSRGQKTEVRGEESASSSPIPASQTPVSGLQSPSAPSSFILHPSFSKCIFLAFAWLVCIETANAVWFRMGDHRAVTNPAWSIQWPTASTGYRETSLSKVELEMLRYDSAKNVDWQDEAGNQWALISLRWAPGNQNSFIGRGHTPDLCFSGAGFRLCSEPPPVRLTVNGIDLPFRRYIFEVNGNTAYVFLALWDERSPAGRQELPLAYDRTSRLKSMLQGKRHQGLKKLEISLIGPSTPEEAVRVLQERLQTLIALDK